MALKVASGCAEAALVKAAGAEVGVALFAQSRLEEVIQPTPQSVEETAAVPMQIIEFAGTRWEPEVGACSEAA